MGQYTHLLVLGWASAALSALESDRFLQMGVLTHSPTPVLAR